MPGSGARSERPKKSMEATRPARGRVRRDTSIWWAGGPIPGRFGAQPRRQPPKPPPPRSTGSPADSRDRSSPTAHSIRRAMISQAQTLHWRGALLLPVSLILLSIILDTLETPAYDAVEDDRE